MKENITKDPRHRKITREYYLQFYADTFEILDKMENSQETQFTETENWNSKEYYDIIEIEAIT